MHPCFCPVAYWLFPACLDQLSSVENCFTVVGVVQMKEYAAEHGLGSPVAGTYFYVREGPRSAETAIWDLVRGLHSNDTADKVKPIGRR